MVSTCNTAVGLKLADHKTDILLISSRKMMKFITITVGDQRIISKWEIKYLRVMIDIRLTVREHLMYIDGKCAATSCALVRIIANV